MKKQLLLILLLVLQSFALLLPPVGSDWIIDGDTVYIDDENAYLSATPHTIIEDTWVTFKLRSKDYEGDIDACWLFNTTNCKPTKPVYYKVGDGDWQTLTKEFTIETIDFENMTKAYLLENINIQKDVNYSLKCFVDIKFNTQGKYWWGVKPSALGWDKGYYIDPWWNSSYKWRNYITIDHTYIDATLTNFPVLVNVSAAISAKCDDGNSIRFLNTDNTTEYYYQIEGTWNASSYNFVWVNITSISSSSDTNFIMYYNNSDATDNQSPANVWDSNYIMVQHLNETTGHHIDSTSNNHDSTTESVTTQGSAGGKIDGADEWDGIDDYVAIPDHDDFTPSAMTIEIWAKTHITTFTTQYTLIAKLDGSKPEWTFYFTYAGADLAAAAVYIYDTDAEYVGRYDNDGSHSPDTNFHLWSATWDGTVANSSGLHIYKDTGEVSIVDDSSGTCDGLVNSDSAVNIGWGKTATPRPWNGTLDEVRISDIVRSESWRNATFHTTNQTSGFLTIATGEEFAFPQTVINTTTGIEGANATLRGYISGNGTGNYNYGFWIGTTNPVTEDNADRNMTGIGTVTIDSVFSHNDSNLSKGTHYYVKSWVLNATFFVSSSNQDNFWTKCDVPSGFTATPDDCYVDIAWTKGTGADKTTVVRKADTYPTSQTDGTVVYNDTASTYEDTTAAGLGEICYRTWSWAGDKHSDENTSANLSVPPCPPTGVDGAILSNNTLNISWTEGIGADTTLVVRKIDSSPSSRTDGTVMYNSTSTYYVATDLTENYFYRLWSYANETYSTSVALDFGALVINTYSEETNDSLYFDALVRNESGTQTYESRNNTNPLVINVVDDLPLGDNIRIIISPASNYSDKTEIFTGYNVVENSTVTYVILLQPPESKALTNVTCTNTTGSTNSYPAFTLADDVITILADAADEFHQITVNYTHYEYDSRVYYRDLVGNHVYILDAFLPDADETELYVLQVIDDYDISVEGVDLEIKHSINGSYEIIASPITDANGKANVYLIPNEDYLVTISKTGYETKNASFIPDPDYYGSYYPIIFRITAEDTDITTVTFGDLITFTGEWITANNTLRVYFNDKDDNTTDVTFSVYESYGVYLNLTNRSAFGSITTVTLYFSGLNTSRMHQIRLEMNHTTLGHVLNQTIYVSPIRDDDRASESWLDSIIAIVMGDFDYGYVAFALLYCPCIFLIISLGAVKQPGFGVLCSGLYIILVTWRIDLSNTFMVALSSLLILFGVIMIIVKHGKKLTGKESN